MEVFEVNNIRFHKFENCFSFPEIVHFVTSRKGGVSPEPYDSLNIGFGTDDFSLNVLENRHKISEALDIPLDNFVMCNQVHGTKVEVVSKLHKGRGALYRDNSLMATDAMITSSIEVCLFVMGADCVPILFFDPVKKIIGAAHAGWRGTVNKIAVETVNKMREVYGCRIDDIHAGIGPSIGPCCYKVGDDVVGEVLHAFGTAGKFIKYNSSDSSTVFDLWYANKYLLMEIGLKEENIETANICTICHSDEFFSSRAGKGITGRFGAGIMLIN